MASTYYEDRHGRRILQHIDASAPMADPSQNIGAIGSNRNSLTDPLTWANQFRRSDNQITRNQLPGGAAPTPAAAPVSTPQSTITQDTLNGIGAFSGGISGFNIRSGVNGQPGYQNTAAPTMTELAQNGSGNHAQSWTESAINGMQRVNKYVQPNTDAKTTYGGAANSRQPYIGGVTDMTNQFADRGDKTLDTTFINRKYNNGFSFASAFR